MQYDNPKAILLRGGKCVDYPKNEVTVYGKKIYESHLKLLLNDELILISDGVVHAGIGFIYNLGWQYENVCEFIEDNYDSSMTAKSTAALLAGACKQLYDEKPGDDATVAVLKMRSQGHVSVMTGPPVNHSDDDAVIKMFLESDGKKVVCGGTTSQIVARYLGEKVEPTLSYSDKSIPPTAEIKGIDLVTEGVLTLNRAISIIKEYSASNDISKDYLDAGDGATKLAKLLLEESTYIKFFVGRAINPAHQNPGFPAELSIKTRLVEELAQSLKDAGKQVEIEYH
jgi:hypothetical protein